EKTGLSNRLTNIVKMYYPQMLEWMDDIDSPLSCAMLKRWPSLQALQRSHPGSWKHFFQEHNCRSQQRIEERIQSMQQAQPAVDDAAILETGPVIVEALIAQIEAI